MSCATTARTVSVWLSVVHWLQALRAWRQRCGQSEGWGLGQAGLRRKAFGVELVNRCMTRMPTVFASSHLMHTLFLIALGSSGRWNAALAWLACLSRKYGSMHAWRRRCQSSALQRQSHLRLVILNRSVRPACRIRFQVERRPRLPTLAHQMYRRLAAARHAWHLAFGTCSP